MILLRANRKTKTYTLRFGFLVSGSVSVRQESFEAKTWQVDGEDGERRRDAKAETSPGQPCVDAELTPIRAAIEAWHAQLSPGTIISLRDNLERLSKECPEITLGTACSGSDIVVIVLRELIDYWEQAFGVSFRLRQSFACESNKAVQNFLLTQFPECEALLPDSSHLGMDWAPTVHGLSSKLARIQSVVLYVAGFVCKSRSPLNNGSPANVGCVQRGQGLTGKSFRSVASYIEKHRPAAVAFENLKALDQPTDTGVSDTDWILRWFREQGYMPFVYRVEAADHGSPCRRVRNFWLAFRGKLAADAEATAVLMQSLIDQTRIPQIAPMEKFFIDEGCRQCVQKKAAEDDEQHEFLYKDDHLRLYDGIGAEWPPSPERLPKLRHHLKNRPYEAVVFCDIAYPYQSGTKYPKQFLDANMSLTRLVGKDGTVDPWSEHFPTMTGSGLYIMREGIPAQTGQDSSLMDQMEHKVVIRQIDGVELMQMAGFALAYLEDPIPAHEVLTSMAGNAFSAFSIGVVMLALFSQLQPPGKVEDGDDFDEDVFGGDSESD